MRPLTSSAAANFEPPSSRLRDQRNDRWAVWTLVTALVGLLIPGLGAIAVVVGCVALAGLQNTRRKGTSLAVSGMVLGIASTVVWIIAIGMYLNGGIGLPGRGGVEMSLDEEPDLAAMEKLRPELRRAMFANVFIEGNAGLLMKMIGSGVIVQCANNQALIATNRHVVDPSFDGQTPGKGKLPEQTLKVRILGQGVKLGQVIWMAPDGIDLAIVSVSDVKKDIEPAIWEPEVPCQVGDNVFVVGNPQGLGWTNTEGQISQIRRKPYGARQVRVLQTSAAINHGNSGGGMYSADGHLLGIPTWTQDKRVAEGLNFAIGFETLLELYPALAKALVQ